MPIEGPFAACESQFGKNFFWRGIDRTVRNRTTEARQPQGDGEDPPWFVDVAIDSVREDSEGGAASSLNEVFVDVALVTQNLHNSLVENTTSSEGMKRLLWEIGELGSGLSVGAEGLNEITFQGMSFAQVHLFRSAQTSIAGLERTGGCAMNDFLFGRLTRSFGYSGLGGKDANEEPRARSPDSRRQKISLPPKVSWRWPCPFSAVTAPKAVLAGVVLGAANWMWLRVL